MSEDEIVFHWWGIVLHDASLALPKVNPASGMTTEPNSRAGRWMTYVARGVRLGLNNDFLLMVILSCGALLPVRQFDFMYGSDNLRNYTPNPKLCHSDSSQR